ncbi:Pyridoxamine 5'-phosphate oxidase family protein [Clavispora lusitaniae]|nr:Pyridoxamine 5'-phosphate oxidase family protein [Clavispora lusitaniae]
MKLFNTLNYSVALLAFFNVSEAMRLNDQVQLNLNLPSRPTMKDGAIVARSVVQRESLANINTLERVFKNNETLYVPVSSMEYYADCDNDGTLYWLVVDIGSTYRNIDSGSAFSFTIRAGDHPLNDHVNPKYPGGIPSSPAGSPRVNLKGHLKNVTFANPVDRIALEKCFLSRHPDAKWWLPSNPASPHKTHWLKFEVEDIYIIGGFGDRAYIGPVDADLYYDAKPVA